MKLLHLVIFLCGLSYPLFLEADAKAPLMTYEIPHHQSRNMHDEIVYPCEVSDWDCIRKFLVANSDCRLANGPLSDSFFVPRLKSSVPSANMTLVNTNMLIEGLSSTKIVKFYYNKSTGNVVISFAFIQVGQRNELTYFTFARLAKEPVTLADYFALKFPLVISTAVMSRVPNLRLDMESGMSSYVADSNVGYAIGPNAFATKDPEVMSQWDTIMANMPMKAAELLSTEAPSFITTFIQQNLCDFGIKAF